MKNEWHKKIFYIETDGFKYKEYILMYRMSQKMLLLSGSPKCQVLSLVVF